MARELFCSAAGSSVRDEDAVRIICATIRLLPDDGHRFVNCGRILTALVGTDSEFFARLQKLVDTEMSWFKNRFLDPKEHLAA